MGRRTLLTPEVEKKLLDALRAGAYLDDAANFCGLGVSTVHEWIARGRADIVKRGETRRKTTLYAQFAESVDHARAEARMHHVLVIRQAARAGQWQASAWFLERTEPGKWGRKDRVEVGGDAAAPLVVSVRDENAADVARTIRDGLAGIPMRPPTE